MASPTAQETVFYSLVIPAVLFFALAAARVIALRGYRSLLDSNETVRASDAEVEGTSAGRRTGVGLASTDYRYRPSFLQIWVACAAPLRMDARRGSLAVAVRELVGALRDQETGVDELDRRFSFDSDDPERLRTLARNIEFQMAMITLAELGVDLVRSEAGVIIAKKRATWIVPVARGRAAEILSALGTMARVMESTLGTSVAALDPPATGAGPRPLVAGGVTFLALAIGVRIVGAYWEVGGWLAWTHPGRWALVAERLPGSSLLACAGTLVAALLTRSSPALSLRIGWTVVVNAAIVWALYAVARNVSIPGLAEQMAANPEFIRGALTSATVTAGIIMGAAILGSIVGSRIRAAHTARGGSAAASSPLA